MGLGFDRFCVRDQGFAKHAAFQNAATAQINFQDFRGGRGEVGIGDGRRIDKARLEIGADGGGEIVGVLAAERAVHALTLLQIGVRKVTIISGEAVLSLPRM